MNRLMALAGIVAMLAACAQVREPAETRQVMGAAAEQPPSTEGAAVAASLGFHGPRRPVQARPGD